MIKAFKQRIGMAQSITQQRKQVPSWLYGAIPHLYLCVGFTTMIVMPNAVGAVAGLFLMSASAAVWFLRDRYRHAFQQSEGRIQLPQWPSRNSTDTDPTPICWNDFDDSGHALLDAQRRHLFGLCSELVTASVNGADRYLLERMSRMMVSFMLEHFHEEEAVNASLERPLSLEHQQQHDALLAKAKDISDRLHAGEYVVREIADFVVYDLLSLHILSERQHLQPRRAKAPDPEPAADPGAKIEPVRPAFAFREGAPSKTTAQPVRRERERAVEGDWTSQMGRSPNANQKTL